MPEDAKPKQ